MHHAWTSVPSTVFIRRRTSPSSPRPRCSTSTRRRASTAARASTSAPSTPSSGRTSSARRTRCTRRSTRRTSRSIRSVRTGRSWVAAEAQRRTGDVARRDRRVRPVGLLRRHRTHLAPAGRGRHVRPPAHAVRTRAGRRRPRPSGYQGCLRRVPVGPRQAFGAVPLQRRGGPAREPRGAPRTSPRRHLRGGCGERPSTRGSRRGSARIARGDRVRRLVQRPPRLRGPRVRPLG